MITSETRADFVECRDMLYSITDFFPSHIVVFRLHNYIVVFLCQSHGKELYDRRLLPDQEVNNPDMVYRT